MHRWTARAAGGTRNRLNPGGAMVNCRSKNDAAMESPIGYALLGATVLNMPRVRELVTTAGLSIRQSAETRSRAHFARWAVNLGDPLRGGCHLLSQRGRTQH